MDFQWSRRLFKTIFHDQSIIRLHMQPVSMWVSVNDSKPVNIQWRQLESLWSQSELERSLFWSDQGELKHWFTAVWLSHSSIWSAVCRSEDHIDLSIEPGETLAITHCKLALIFCRKLPNLATTCSLSLQQLRHSPRHVTFVFIHEVPGLEPCKSPNNNLQIYLGISRATQTHYLE